MYGTYIKLQKHEQEKRHYTQPVYFDHERKGVQFNTEWKLIARAKFYSPATGRWNLCLKEKEEVG